jgi:uncharacterized protein with FMN-binding domain
VKSHDPDIGTENRIEQNFRPRTQTTVAAQFKERKKSCFELKTDGKYEGRFSNFLCSIKQRCASKHNRIITIKTAGHEKTR